LGFALPWFASVESPLGLAEQRAVLANRRSARAFWEIEARGGSPVVAVNWWATYPAARLAGLVVAHGAHELLSTGAPGVVEPPAARTALLDLLSAPRASLEAAEPFASALAASLGGEASAALLARSFAADRFYRDATRWGTERSPGARAVAVYLPGLDIAAAGWRGGAAALADLARLQLAAGDAFLRAASEGRTLVVVFDPGRRGGGEGRALIWRPDTPCSQERGTLIAAEAVASILLRVLGWPQSAELPEPPALCPWPEPSARIASYGVKLDEATGPASEEYLETLRSLGYL
jgi:hypothetical protein